MKSNLELPDEVYLTTLLTLPIVFLPYNKNGKTNLLKIFTIDSGFNSTNTDDPWIFCVLRKIPVM